LVALFATHGRPAREPVPEAAVEREPVFV
jgi:hypothetical protein